MKADEIIRMQTLVANLLENQGLPHSEICFILQDRNAAFPSTHDSIAVEVRSSGVHGKGVFAIKDIEPGEFITYYPCHGLAHRPFNGGEEVMFSSRNKNQNLSMDYAQSLKVDGDPLVYLVGDPSIDCKPRALAHLINDAYPKTNEIQLTDDIAQFGKQWLTYQIEGAKRANADIKTEKYFAYAVATKHIKKDQEILTLYGFPYWYKDNLFKIGCKWIAYLNTLNEKQRAIAFNIMRNAM